jgi:signal peptide peptidase SppA
MYWAIEPTALAAIHGLAGGDMLLPPALETTDPQPPHRPGSYHHSTVYPNAIAVMDIHGHMINRADRWDKIIDGAIDTQELHADLRQLLADPTVETIVLDIDSPGGTVPGIQEFAEEIYQARGTKPIIAWANGVATSAAYWIASAADTVLTTPTTVLGSIGVLATHIDASERYRSLGIKVTHIKSGKDKDIGSPYKPLDEYSQATIQARIDHLSDLFLNSVARNRGIPPAAAQATLGNASVFIGNKAIEAGLADAMPTNQEIKHMNVQTLMQRFKSQPPADDQATIEELTAALAAAAEQITTLEATVATAATEAATATAELDNRATLNIELTANVAELTQQIAASAIELATLKATAPLEVTDDQLQLIDVAVQGLVASGRLAPAAVETLTTTLQILATVPTTNPAIPNAYAGLADDWAKLPKIIDMQSIITDPAPTADQKETPQQTIARLRG